MKKWFLFILFFVIICVFLSWVVFNWYLIPNKLLPAFEKNLPSFLPTGVEIKYSKIAFSPFTGFMICDFELISEGSVILSGGTLDIDIDIIPLLEKKVIIYDLGEDGMQVNIERDKTGKWNIEKIREVDFFEEMLVEGWQFEIKKFRINDCRINFVDAYKSENSLNRKLEGVNLQASSPGENIYHLDIDTPGEKKSHEDFSIDIDYDQNKKTFSGSVKGKSRFLESYADYYIDEIFHPWKMKTEEASVDIHFSSSEKVFSLMGEYDLGKIVLKYGDVIYKGDISVIQDFEYSKTEGKKSYNNIDLTLKDAELSAGKTSIIKNAFCKSELRNNRAVIKEFSGDILGKPASFTGEGTFSQTRKVSLQGKAFEMGHVVHFEMPEDNKASFEWKANFQDSFFSIMAKSENLKDMDFTADATGSINIEEFLPDKKISGKTDFKLKVSGELDKLDSLKGKGTINCKALCFYELEIEPVKAGIMLNKGIVDVKGSPVEFYSGHMNFLGRVDITGQPSRWGFEVDLTDVNIADVEKAAGEISKGLKGVLSGNLVCTGISNEKKSIKGGGYFDIKNNILWEMPVFKTTKEGIENVATKVELPVLDEVTGNYNIENCTISTKNTHCKAKSMEIRISGSMKFSGDTDMTVGVKFARLGPLGLLSNPLNILAECIQVRIKGKYPELTQNAEIKPIGWLLSIFPGKRADKKKYSLEKVWGSN